MENRWLSGDASERASEDPAGDVGHLEPSKEYVVGLSEAAPDALPEGKVWFREMEGQLVVLGG